MSAAPSASAAGSVGSATPRKNRRRIEQYVLTDARLRPRSALSHAP
jgi:hypothetical protein